MAELLERNAVGNREDLSDLIAVVDARSTPIVSMAKKGKAPRNSLVEWQVDNYPDPQTAGVVDGADVTTFENLASGRQKLQARIQIFQRSPKVSTLQEDVANPAGVGNKKEYAKAVAKGLVMVKRDIEATCGSDNESQADDGTNAYKTRGLGKWIQATAQSDLPVNASYLTPAASINTTATASLAESDVKAVLQSLWDEVGAVKTFALVCGRALKSKFADFTMTSSGATNVYSSIRMFSQDGTAKKIVSAVDIYEGDFGTFELIPAPFLAWGSAAAVRRARGYVIDQDMLELRFAEQPNHTELPNLGGGRRGVIRAIGALCLGNPLGFAKFAATS